jgi:hypothetical protein
MTAGKPTANNKSKVISQKTPPAVRGGKKAPMGKQGVKASRKM